jgi:hypothetical protein
MILDWYVVINWLGILSKREGCGTWTAGRVIKSSSEWSIAKANPKLQLGHLYTYNRGMREFCATQMDLPYTASRLVELDSISFRCFRLTQLYFNSFLLFYFIYSNSNYSSRVALDGKPWTWSKTRNRMQTPKFKNWVRLILALAWAVTCKSRLLNF